MFEWRKVRFLGKGGQEGGWGCIGGIIGAGWIE
jgi:hypothetical protein